VRPCTGTIQCSRLRSPVTGSPLLGRVDPIFPACVFNHVRSPLESLRSVGVTAGSLGASVRRWLPAVTWDPVVLRRARHRAPCSCALRDELKVSLWSAPL